MERFNLDGVLFEHEPRFNIAPGQIIPVIISREGETLAGFKWGLVPHWAGGPSIGNRMINVRAETLLQKPAFRETLERRRCLIPADGFYEWRKLSSGKQPVYIRRKDGNLFAFAGLWEKWTGPDGRPLFTATIVTMRPNRIVSEVHDRMPAMLDQDHETEWLDWQHRRPDAIVSFLRPYDDDLLEAFEVSRSVNRVENDSPELIMPINKRTQNRRTAMSEAAKPEMVQHPNGNFCWVELATTDDDAAKRFYSSVLGWDYEDTSMGPDQVYTMVNIGGKTIGALYKIGSEQQGMPPNWQPYINVNSADETVAKARALGASIVVEPFDVAEHGRMAVFADPTGATIAIWQPKAHHGAQLVNAPGAMCWNELQTRDPKSAVQFFRGLLGWEAKESPEYTEWVNQGKEIGGMMEMKGEKWKGIPSHWITYFAIEDCDKTVAAARANGGTVYVEPTDIPNTGRFAVLADPQGAAFAVIQLNG